MAWPVADAAALLGVIEQIDEEGLIPADYRPDGTARGDRRGPGPALDEVASKSFAWLAEDLRDGRTPMTARQQWFVVDPDIDANPTAGADGAGARQRTMSPACLPASPRPIPITRCSRPRLRRRRSRKRATRTLIAANMDRWRWLPRELGKLFLITNVPEYQLRLATNNRIVRTYRTIVGKPGKTATPQLAAQVENVVFNPTWTVPQSIVVGEGLGARLIAQSRCGAPPGLRGQPGEERHRSPWCSSRDRTIRSA